MNARPIFFVAAALALATFPHAICAQEAASAATPSVTRAGLPYLLEGQVPASELVDAMRASRAGGKLLKLDRVLLHSPGFARGWSTMFGMIRTKMSLDPKLRELTTMAIAVMNNAQYEWVSHKAAFLTAGGTKAQLAALRDVGRSEFDATPFDETERAALELTVEMTRDVAVQPATMGRVRGLMSDQNVVELIGTISGYNMVSRFLVATGVDLE